MKLNNEEFKDSLDYQLDALHVEGFAYTLFAKADFQRSKNSQKQDEENCETVLRGQRERVRRVAIDDVVTQ